METKIPPTLQGATLYFDCAAGISGDMTVAALVDLGVPELVMRQALDSLPIAGYRISFERTTRMGITGTKFCVELDHAVAHGHTDYRAIRRMLEEASLGAGVRERACAMFERLAVVEAKIHGVAKENVKFHEVGAIDSIVDLVAVAAGLDWLAPVHIAARRVPLGSGWVNTAHGRLPLPAPATLELLAGAEIEDGGSSAELTTPTGAVILACHVQHYGVMPPLELLAAGWGAGDKEFTDRPNMLRIIAGRGAPSVSRLMVIEANIDDMTPEMAAPLIEALGEAGARDAWITPVLMKKGRPGWVVAALAESAVCAQVETTLLRESTTIGLRRYAVERNELERKIVQVTTTYGVVAVKVAMRDGAVWNAAPEFEVCRRIARELHVSLKQVYAAALAAYHLGL